MNGPRNEETPMSDATKQDLADLEERVAKSLAATEKRIIETLQVHSKLSAAAMEAAGGFTEWVSKADADYTRVLKQLSDLEIRLAKLERPA